MQIKAAKTVRVALTNAQLVSQDEVCTIEVVGSMSLMPTSQSALLRPTIMTCIPLHFCLTSLYDNGLVPFLPYSRAVRHQLHIPRERAIPSIASRATRDPMSFQCHGRRRESRR